MITIKSRFAPVLGPYNMDYEQARQLIKKIRLQIRGKPNSFQKKLDYLNNSYVVDYRFTLEEIQG